MTRKSHVRFGGGPLEKCRFLCVHDSLDLDCILSILLEPMNSELPSVFGRLLSFLSQLEEIKIHYDLKHVRDSIMVQAYLPIGTWEIEFFEDGTIEVELLTRQAGVERVSEEWLGRFVEENRD
jgi:hypothetical protein